MQSNLALTYRALGRGEEALDMRREVYSVCLKLLGGEHQYTLLATSNYALSLLDQQRPHQAKSLLRRTLPVARRFLSDGHELTIQMRWSYARALYRDDGATPDDLREAVKTLEETERTARRVLGGAHPLVAQIASHLGDVREVLDAFPLSPGGS